MPIFLKVNHQLESRVPEIYFKHSKANEFSAIDGYTRGRIGKVRDPSGSQPLFTDR